jgi:NADH:ubiquinone oxidoreductase subunit 5 (subunit L)/multisubunit Na+/H+ antiporter MnhA subunit
MTTRTAALVAALQAACGDTLADVTVALDEVTIVIKPEALSAVATTLRDAPELRFEQLIDLCGVDYRDYGEGSASSEQGSRLRDANVREADMRPPSADPMTASGVTSPKGAPVPPSGGHGDHGHGGVPHESPAVITVPLVLLAIPSVVAGWVIGPMLFGGYFGDAIVVAPGHDVLAQLGGQFQGAVAMMVHAVATPVLWLTLAGIAAAWYLYLKRPDLPAIISTKLGFVYKVLERKYGFDEAYQWLFGDGAVRFGTGLWKGGDMAVIDGVFVDGSARAVGWVAAVIRTLQSGFIYHYAFAMIIGVLVLLTLMFFG